MTGRSRRLARPRYIAARRTLDPFTATVLVIGVLVVGPIVSVMTLLDGDVLGALVWPAAAVITLTLRWWWTR